jgi:hypothetical protein
MTPPFSCSRLAVLAAPKLAKAGRGVPITATQRRGYKMNMLDSSEIAVKSSSCVAK